ncbi:hypothetical protein JGU66_25925 [Myxococcaceae bacterium JPH2]|nr:hypothetical protein [Myxococcaceae bacterium JPH2]
MPTRSHSLARIVATLLVAFWAVQPLGMVLHVQEHAHRFCPEHQAFEESARGTSMGMARLAASAPTLSSVPAAVADSTRPTHETCPILTGAPQLQALHADSGVRPQTCWTVSPPATAPPTPFTPLAVLDTAPKASPPVRSLSA